MAETQNQATAGSERRKIAEALLKLKLLTPDQLDLLKDKSVSTGRPLEQIAHDMGMITDEDIAKATGEVMGLPYVDLRQVELDRKILFKIPEQVAKQYLVAAFARSGSNRYKIAMADPRDVQALQAVEFATKQGSLQADLYVASQESLRAAIQQYGSLTGEVTEVLNEAKKDEEVEDVEEDLQSAQQLERVVSDAPMAKAVGAILKYAAQTGVSDIHIEPTETEIRIRYRIDGVLANTVNLPRKAHAALVSRIKVLSNMKIDESRVPQDGRFNSMFDNKEIDFRVSTFPTMHGEKVVLRLLDKSSGVKTLEEIGVSGRGFDKLVEGINRPYGMTLVTGPTGSGKSTTLYAALGRLNDVAVNIVTLEDPVEYDMVGINQSQINPEIGYDFANGLRSILRQDPDIVMVGEIRDRETAEMAVQAALTGHIVFSTLHTNDAAGALPRLIDMEVEPFLIASSVNTILAQRLVRKICSHCKRPAEISDSERETVQKIIADMPKQTREKLKPLGEYTFQKGEGCNACNKTGYKGRTGIFEVLPLTEPVKDLLLQRADGTDIKEEAIKEGMVTMQQDGILKALDGITTVEEVMIRTKE
jgi:type IV pilus assembly protein PilB